ncbi:MAG TPA: COX15/CtaA family protein [Thermoanaerobaculia bacterium]|nr:COX15/CtaA family protein [Thermoanaerobaculia bacterium]
MADQRPFAKTAAAPPRPRGLHGFAVGLAGATLLLVFAGGLVTSTESGLSVPDWPTTYGQNMFTFPVSKWVGGIRYEHVHRLIASGIGLLTVVLAIWLARREPRRWVRRLGYLALGAVVAQGLLGGLTVLLLLPPAVSVAHACLAQTFFCLIVTIAVVTSPRWTPSAPTLRASLAASPSGRFAAVTAGAVFLQLLVGAIMRHTNAGLAIPDFPLALGRVVPPLTTFPVAIHFLHRVGALVVAALVGFCALSCARTHRAGLRRAGFVLVVLTLAQIALGAATVLTKKSVAITTAHVAAGALLLGSTVALCASSLAAERRRNNVIPIRSAIARSASGWK